MTDAKSLIAAHRHEIEAEIKRHHSEISRLQQDLRELDIADRVFGRISNPTIGKSATHAVEGIVGEMPVSTKPEGIPTMPDMIASALAHARKRGLAGLEPKGMTDFISEKWWPNVPGVAVSPIAWRMWKRGELEKNGARYSLPKDTETADLLTTAGSAASDPTSTEARKPEPGGGT